MVKNEYFFFQFLVWMGSEPEPDQLNQFLWAQSKV